MKLIIVTGCQRSGTTLTGQILGAHPDCFLIDEEDHLYAWFEAWLNQASDADERLARTLSAAARKYSDERRQLTTAGQLERFQLVLKAPNLAYHCERLAALRPLPRIVFPVRDARAVVASMRRLASIPMADKQLTRLRAQPKLAEKYAAFATRLADRKLALEQRLALVWTIKTSLFDDFERFGLSPLVFRYEDLIADPPTWVNRLAAHCGLSADSALLNHAAFMQGQGPGNTERTRSIDAASLGRWSQELDEQTLAWIQEIGGQLMRRLGYSD